MTMTDGKQTGAGSTSGSASGGPEGGAQSGRGRTGETSAAAESLAAARARAADAYQAAREKTSAAYGSARDTAATAGRRTADGIDANPMAALVGGLALGAIAAAFLPRTRREEEMFGQVGQRITDTARDAARAAREAGREKLDEIGLNAETARQRASELVGSSASAAVETVRGQRQ